MMIPWDAVRDDLEPQLRAALAELEQPKVAHERTQYLRGRIAALRFALELPERRERLERLAAEGKGKGMVLS